MAKIDSSAGDDKRARTKKDEKREGNPMERKRSFAKTSGGGLRPPGL